MANKKTVIIGATDRPGRYAFVAARMLKEHGQSIVPMSIHGGVVSGENILNLYEKPAIEGVDTITMYINPSHQAEWEEYILSLAPKRVIFNPGTENQGFRNRLNSAGIETVEGCTLVMLRSNQY